MVSRSNLFSTDFWDDWFALCSWWRRLFCLWTIKRSLRIWASNHQREFWCMGHQAQERPCWQEPVQPKPRYRGKTLSTVHNISIPLILFFGGITFYICPFFRQRFWSWLALSWCRCLLAMVPNWYVTHLLLPKRKLRPSSSLMSWMLSAPSALIVKKLETERCREPCWSFLTNLTAFSLTCKWRSVLRDSDVVSKHKLVFLEF